MVARPCVPHPLPMLHTIRLPECAQTQDSSSKTLDPVAAVALLCQKLLDKGLIQAVYEKRFGLVGRSMRGRGMKSNPMIGLNFMTTTMYSLNTNLRHGEMSSLTDLAQSFHIS